MLVATVLPEFTSGQLLVTVAAVDLHMWAIDSQVILEVNDVLEFDVALEAGAVLLAFAEVGPEVLLVEQHEGAQIGHVVGGHPRPVAVAAVMRLEDFFELSPDCEVLALREEQSRILIAARATCSEIRLLKVLRRVLRPIEVLLLHEVVLALLANDCLAADALADLERDLVTYRTLEHARHRVDLAFIRWIWVEVDLRPTIELFEQLLMRNDELFSLLQG